MLNFISIIKPRYIIAIALGVAVLMFTSAYIELRQSREELYHVLQEHSLSLAESITNSSANIVLSTDRIEEQLSERLLNNAHLIAALDSLSVMNGAALKSIASRNGIFRINIFNRWGKRIMSSHTPELHSSVMKEKNSPGTILRPILQGTAEELVIGLKEARFEEGQRYAVAVRRTNKAGGAIVLNLDAAQFIEFRKEIGIGKLVTDLGNNTGIEYVVIQDEEGILAATKDVQEMSTVDNDPLLSAVLVNDTTVSREVSFHHRNTYEIVKRLSIDGAAVGVLRIGLSLDELRAIDSRMQRRMIIMSIVFVLLGVILFSFIIALQNVKLISGKYSSIRSLTGNILEHMNDAVVTIDRDRKVTIFNRQAETLFGIESHRAIGLSIEQLPERIQSCLSSITSKKEEQMEQSLWCSNNDERIVSISTSTTTNDAGIVETWTAVIKDLTEAKRLEKEIQRKEKMTAMGALAAGVAHEIRNPLNAISMIAQRYEKEFSPKKGVREYQSLTNVLKKESLRMNGIIQQFLNFARPQKVQLLRTSAAAFIDHVATLFRPQTGKKKIAFAVHADEVDLSIDFEQMTQALLNLLQNALDATPHKGSIELSLRSRNSDIIIEVSDTGAGVPEELKEKIFNLYFTTKSSGSGMGLSITQQIVSQHNGSLSVKQNQPKGTIFTITLPSAV
ncbi:MAG: ATP-binding protein [Bacteroidota bacterium]